MLLRIIAIMAGTAVAALARTPWETSRVNGTPEPQKPFLSQRVFPGIPADNALEMRVVEKRVFLLTRQGKLSSFRLDHEGGPGDLALDLKALHPELDSAYSFVFHPEWKKNRQIYLVYAYGQGVENGSKLARFRLTEADPPRVIPESEEILLTWLAGGHNGSQLQFGPDGYLYVSTGDGKAPSPPDELNTGQDNSDLLCCILRIDVNRGDQGRPYAIPPDNPFVAKLPVRPEIWAFGLRNPWRFSFDSANGNLWCGDVGWELWEMIHLVKRGGNYGWSAMEASQPIKPETASPLAPIMPPIVAHPHTEAASITGGYVYHGKKFPELQGAYLYGDYETGKVWALWYDGARIARHEEIADTPYRIASFALDEEGELYFLHWGTPGGIYGLARNPHAGKASSFPMHLSETGLFDDVARQTPASGVFSFEVREPMWQDGATARRFIGLPGSSTITTQVNRRKDGSVAETLVKWPVDAVLAKTLQTGRNLETQLLHFDGESWKGYSYRWNAEGTDAELVGANGAEDPAWRFAARAECMRCHNSWSGFALGFQPQQLRAVLDHGSAADPLSLADPEYFSQSTARLVDSHDAGSPLDIRARSWLHANCAHCHRRHGGGSVPLMVNMELGLDETDMLDKPPARGDFGLPDAKVIAPGEPWRSVVPYRLATLGGGHMPLLGAREPDVRQWQMLWQWIESMPSHKDATMASEVSNAMREVHRLRGDGPEKLEQERLVGQGLASANANVRGLYEAFLPPEKREARLGASIDAQGLLARAGNRLAGESLLSPTGKAAVCLACHFVRGTGRDFGPDLTSVGGRLTKAQILDSLLHPSAIIAPEFRAHAIESNDQAGQTGFVVREDSGQLLLKVATGQTIDYARPNIKRDISLPGSLMPEGLLQAFTAQEAADLLAYLESLK